MVYFKVTMEHYGVPYDDFLLEIPNGTSNKGYQMRLESMVTQWLKQTNERRKKFKQPCFQRKEFFPYVQFLGKSK